MASLFSSVIQFHNTLTGANFPGGTRTPAYEHPVPLTTAAGAQLRPPYATYALAPLNDLLTFEDESMERWRLVAVAFADSQSDADLIIACIRFNGQALSAHGGLDGRNTLTNFTDGTILSIVPTKPANPGYAGIGISGQRIHTATMEWEIETERS